MPPHKLNNFLADIIEADLSKGKTGGQVVTRFPPEPNGFLHIGHSKSILLNFGLAGQYGGRAHLRFDDTNPTTEETLYVESIQRDVRWLGADWGPHLYFASDYFPRMYECAVRLVKEGKAYVDSQDVDAIREQRGSFEKPGVPSPHRNRPVDENLALFRQMREGKFPDGGCVLRAKIDMSHPNVLMRDPLLYRIRHAHHHRTGDAWPIYPMYDFAHPLEDAFEGVTHSICTLEFETNRELYDWVLDNLGPWNPRPYQYEFARLALGYTVMSKRKLLQLVTEKRVSGWDDPRMPTLAGLRRRGVTPEALRDFNEMIGVAKNNSLVDIGKLEHAIRKDLEGRAPRAMAVLNPLHVIITNWPRDKVEPLELPWWPGEPGRGGTRQVPFGAELLLEQEDFTEQPAADWKRLAPGWETRLIGAYVIRCNEVVRDGAGKIRELRCTYDPDSKGGAPADKRKIPGTLHWVHAPSALKVEVRLYDRLFTVEQPDAAGDFLTCLNPNSLVATHAFAEPALAQAQRENRFQFLRQGYFFVDPLESKGGAPVFNRIISLKDTWAKAEEPAPERRPEKKKAEPRAGAPKRSRTEARDKLRAATPALAERFERYQKSLGLSGDEADLLTASQAIARFFDAALRPGVDPKVAAKWVVNELLGVQDPEDFGQLSLSPADFGRFVALLQSGKLAPAAGKTLIADLLSRPGDPEQRMRELGLERLEGGRAIAEAVERVLGQHAAEVTRYRSGEKKLLGVLIGAVMRETAGKADAGDVRKALSERLG